MPPINATIMAVEPIAYTLQNLMGWIQWLVGGLFGLYLIYFAIIILKRQQEIKMLREIRNEIKHLHEVLIELHKKKK